MRATASTPPPAGNGTIMVIDRVGYRSCAIAPCKNETASAETIAAVANNLVLLFMLASCRSRHQVSR
jgi:hypothetical protein